MSWRTTRRRSSRDVREGQAVDIEVDMFPGKIVHGHVDSIAPASGQEFALLPPDNATGNFTKVVQRIPVRIALDSMRIPHRTAAGHVGRSRRIRRRASSANRAAAASANIHKTVSGASCHVKSEPFRLDIRAADLARSIVARPPIRTAPASRPGLPILAAMIGSFMAILNIQITNASLLNIEGGIGTGVDNGSWISTSYLIGEIVVIPLTDYLSRVFSFRRYMIASRQPVRRLLGRLRLHPRPALDDRDARDCRAFPAAC